MKFANLVHTSARQRNYGDDIQVYAIELLYKYMKIDYNEVVKITLPDLFTYDGEEYLVVPINLIFMSLYEKKLSDKIIPVYLGVSLLGEFNIEAMRMKQFEPIGCRDQKTFEMVRKCGISAYLNGCMTLTLPRAAQRKASKVFIVDACDKVMEYIPNELKEDAEYRTHIIRGREVSQEESLAVYEQYQKEAKLVITSRLHCAVPCIAYGIPVIYVPEKRSSRSAWLQKIVPVYDKTEYQNIDWFPKPVEIEPLKKLLLENAAKRVRDTWDKYFLQCSITEKYEDKALYGKIITEDMYAPIEYMQKHWKKDENSKYIIWGITQTAETIYQYIQEHYKNASLVGVIDMYRHTEFHGMVSGGTDLLEREKDALVFVTVTGANKPAIELFSRMNKRDYVICLDAAGSVPKLDDDIEKALLHMTKQSAVAGLMQENQNITALLPKKGAYIWGTGRLGKFVYEQCEKNDIVVNGYIDNNKDNLDDEKNIFSCDILKQDDIVIIASFYCVDIMEQLKGIGVRNYIYYENLAIIMDGFATYYQAFLGIHEELEENKAEYIKLYNALEDDLSKKIYTDILHYRISLDTKYTVDALKLSLRHGPQYFDKIIVEKADKNITFFDAGGFDGDSTLNFLTCIGDYQKVYFFEPDKNIMERAKMRLANNEKIVFMQAGVGEKSDTAHYDAVGGGAGNISEDGAEMIQMVALDDYIVDRHAYVKMDIEGYEMQALEGMKNAIMQYKPMLAVSVYHKCGDMHKLVNTILSWNPGYKVYMRHYSETYADTVCYFIDKER